MSLELQNDNKDAQVSNKEVDTAAQLIAGTLHPEEFEARGIQVRYV